MSLSSSATGRHHHGYPEIPEDPILSQMSLSPSAPRCDEIYESTRATSRKQGNDKHDLQKMCCHTHRLLRHVPSSENNMASHEMLQHTPSQPKAMSLTVVPHMLTSKCTANEELSRRCFATIRTTRAVKAFATVWVTVRVRFRAFA